MRLQAIAIGLAYGIARLGERRWEGNDGPVFGPLPTTDHAGNAADVPGVFSVNELDGASFAAQHRLRRKAADDSRLKPRGGNCVVHRIDVGLYEGARPGRIP